MAPPCFRPLQDDPEFTVPVKSRRRDARPAVPARVRGIGMNVKRCVKITRFIGKKTIMAGSREVPLLASEHGTRLFTEGAKRMIRRCTAYRVVCAVEAVDSSIGRVIESLKKVGGECLITADHGNCERMKDLTTGQPYTAHTNLPVPFIYYGRKAHMREGGRLCDIAPTMLYLMGMPIPEEMTGTSIVTLDE